MQEGGLGCGGGSRSTCPTSQNKHPLTTQCPKPSGNCPISKYIHWKPPLLRIHLRISPGTTGFLGLSFHLPPHSFPFPWRKGGKSIQHQRAGGQASDVTFRRPSCRGQEEFLATSSCLWLSPAPEIPEHNQQSPKNLKLYVK